MPVPEEVQTEAAQQPYYTLSAEHVSEIFGTGPAGLSAAEALERLEQYGPNELAPPKKISPWTIFFRQFQNLLIIILIAATGISFFLGEHLDAYVILVIILACTVLGFVQEYRAEQAAAALQKLAAPEAAVLRDGREQVIAAREVVPGDVLVLHTGDRCAADGRVLEAVNLKNDESLLTGESTSVNKNASPDPRSHLPVADQKGMVFGGTVVTYGGAVEEGRAIFDNIKKYLLFLLSANLAEITVLTGTFFLGMPLPLVALQILWVNLTTDGLPALALGVDPKSPDIMQRPPRPPEEGVFTRSVIALMVVITAYLTIALIPLFHHYYHGYLAVTGDPELSLTRAQTMVFVTLVLAELVNAFNCRSEYHSIFRVGVLANRFLLLATLISLGMVVAVVQVPPLAQLFHAVPLGWKEWLFAAFLAFLLLPVVEVTKWLMRQGTRRMAVSS